MRFTLVARGASVPLLASILMAGCGNPPASPSATVRPSPSATPNPTPSPSPSQPVAAAPVLSVTGSAAFATNAGTLGVAVIHNGDNRDATGVHVTVTATSSNGEAPVQASASISGLAAGATQAVTVSLAIPASDNIGAVSATASADAAGSYADPVTAGAAHFSAADFQPEVILSVTNVSPAPVHAIAVAVCYDASGKLIGAGASQPVVLAASETRSEQLSVSALDTPDYCRGYASPV